MPCADTAPALVRAFADVITIGDRIQTVEVTVISRIEAVEVVGRSVIECFDVAVSIGEGLGLDEFRALLALEMCEVIVELVFATMAGRLLTLKRAKEPDPAPISAVNEVT